MTIADEIAAKRTRMVEHLEAVQALADDLNDGATGYLIETALIKLRDDDKPERQQLPKG